MQYRNFKDVQIAEVGLGTWQLGSADWGNIDEQEAFSILDAYTGAGGNFIDTADVYGMGKLYPPKIMEMAEPMIATLLRRFLAVGYIPNREQWI